MSWQEEVAATGQPQKPLPHSVASSGMKDTPMHRAFWVLPKVLIKSYPGQSRRLWPKSLPATYPPAGGFKLYILRREACKSQAGGRALLPAAESPDSRPPSPGSKFQNRGREGAEPGQESREVTAEAAGFSPHRAWLDAPLAQFTNRVKQQQTLLRTALGIPGPAETPFLSPPPSPPGARLAMPGRDAGGNPVAAAGQGTHSARHVQEPV